MERLSHVQVVAAPLPFSNQQIHLNEAPGTTLAQMVEKLIPGYKVGMVHALVTVNGHAIYPEYWARVRPKKGTLVNIRIVPTGGGGKNPLATLLTIAVMIAAPYAAGAFATTAALTVFGGGVATAGQVALMQGALTAAFSIAGRLAVQALAPPPKLSGAALPNTSPTQFIEGARNGINAYGVVPICLGTNRMVPLLAARNFTETEGADQYVRQLFTWGYGNKLSLTDIRIGDTPLDKYTDYELEHVLDGRLHQGTRLYANNVFEEAIAIQVSQALGWIERTVRADSDEALIDLTFASGLFSTDHKKGWMVLWSVGFDIAYKEVGASVWTPFASEVISGSNPQALRKTFRIVFPARGDYIVRLRRTSPDVDNIKIMDKATWSALRSVRYQNPVTMEGLNGTALRMKATDQLNGVVDQFNGLVTLHVLDYVEATDDSVFTWVHDFTENLPDGMKFSRLSVATGWPSATMKMDYAFDEPRIEVEPSTGTGLGILLEKSSTNIVSPFPNSWQTPTAQIRVNNDGFAPDGSFTAISMTETLATANRAFPIVDKTVTNNIVYTYSAHAKADTNFILQHFVSFMVTNQRVNFNLNNATIAFTASPFVSSIKALSDGWCRTRVSVPVGTVNPVGFNNPMVNNDPNAGRGLTYTGTGRRYFIWMVQMEPRPYNTSQIISGVSATTRAPDVLICDDLRGTFGYDGGGTFVLTFSTLGLEGVQTVVAFYQDAEHDDNRVALYIESGVLKMEIKSGSSIVATLTLGSVSGGATHTVRFNLKNGASWGELDNNPRQVTSAVFHPEILTLMHLGSMRGTGLELDGHLSAMAYRPLRVWEETPTNNPASLYRFVLQSYVNVRGLPDSKIDIKALEAWHQYCQERGYTYNRVIDFEISVNDLLRDIASAGAASPDMVDGKRTVVVDRAKDIITQMVTPRNSWGYTGSMSYPNLPHGMRITFRNAEKGYLQDERIVYNDGYSETNASIFETVDVTSCTNPELAYKVGRRMLAQAKLRPETHSFMMDVENLVSLRGDRIKFEHDVPMVGVGDGRVKDLWYDSLGDVAGVVLDDTIGIPSTGTYFVRLRGQDGSQLYKQIVTSVGNTTDLEFFEPEPPETAPQVGDLAMVSAGGGEHDLIITRIEPAPDLTARITCVDYAAAIFDAETGVIPSWNSNITVPLDMQRPQPPVLVNAQSDSNAMLRNPDGSLTARAIFTLQNPNESNLDVFVRVRLAGESVFSNADVLEALPERVMLTGLDDGSRYDIWIYYTRRGGSVYSLPLQLNNYLFEGATDIPADVQNFRISVTGDAALFRWEPNTEIDISHYVMRFTSLFNGATWGNAQLLQDNIRENNITLPFQGGTYLIKAVDFSGNESLNPGRITTFDPGTMKNAVEILTESPDFVGAKDNVTNIPGAIILGDTTLGEGYYYFSQDLDLDGVFTSYVSASVIAGGMRSNNLFPIDDLFAEDDLFGVGGDNDLFAEADLFEVADLFGLGEGGWDVLMEFSITLDDPDETGALWSDWAELVTGNIEFRAIRFRLRLRSLEAQITPVVQYLSVLIDMPDRIERGEDVTVTPDGLVVDYGDAFKSNPAVVITIQDADQADEPRFDDKTRQGFKLRIYNVTAGTYVTRICDFVASGYGRDSL